MCLRRWKSSNLGGFADWFYSNCNQNPQMQVDHFAFGGTCLSCFMKKEDAFGNNYARRDAPSFASALTARLTDASASSSVSVRSEARSRRLNATLFLPASICLPS